MVPPVGTKARKGRDREEQNTPDTAELICVARLCIVPLLFRCDRCCVMFAEGGFQMVRHGLFALAVLCFVQPAFALDPVGFEVKGASADLAQALRGASLLLTAEAEGEADPQDLFAAARADYGQLLGALYARGYYSGVIRITIDGREVAGISPLEAPAAITRMAVVVEPGAEFTFGRASVAPLADGTVLPPGFATGQVAASGEISDAARAAVLAWRAKGHARAEISAQDITADHRKAELSADLRVSAGPRLRFGKLTATGQARMNTERLLKIAGLPEGKTYSPDELEAAADRLRRTGVFRSVALIEDAAITAPDLLGITARVVEEKTRRFGAGAEIASSEGAKVSGYWLHRNLLGGAERLRIEGSVAQIGAQDSGIDYALGATLERPATFSRDTTASLTFQLAQENEADYSERSGLIGFGLSHYFSKKLTARAGAEFAFYDVTFNNADTIFRNLSLPVGLTWDNRNSKTDATGGVYLDAEISPFFGFSTTESGGRIDVDARAYRAFGEDDKVTFAARLQARAVLGASLSGVPADYLVYSGGGGTVRGQPYQSLGFAFGNTTLSTGGTGFLGASFEVRAKVTKSIGVVGFADFGQIASDGLFGGQTASHAGAGLGLRYATGLGPIRLDLAAPVSGATGKGLQVYIGIGQAF